MYTSARPAWDPVSEVYLGSDLTSPPLDAFKGFPDEADGRRTVLKGGGDFLGVGGLFTFSGDDAALLLQFLPPCYYIPAQTEPSVLHWALSLLQSELQYVTEWRMRLAKDQLTRTPPSAR